MINGEIAIRQVTIIDLADLVRLRRMMFEAMGFNDPAQLDAADASAAIYFSEAIPSESFHGWLAIASNGEAVASGGVVIDQHPPTPSNLSGKIGYIMNLVTDPRYRRQGIACQLMKTMIMWLADQGIQLIALHATENGRPLYEELGFIDSSEMQLKIE